MMHTSTVTITTYNTLYEVSACLHIFLATLSMMPVCMMHYPKEHWVFFVYVALGNIAVIMNDMDVESCKTKQTFSVTRVIVEIIYLVV